VRSLLCILLCAATVLAATIARAEQSANGFYTDPDTLQYMPVQNIDPDRAKTLGLATFIGTMTGLIFGGLVLIFYWNPIADRVFPNVLIMTGATGCAAGIVLGMTLPANAARESAPASLDFNKTASLDFNLPHVTFDLEPTHAGLAKVWRGNIFKITF
jgi:hypothetical protein